MNYDNILEAVGRTPLVRLHRICEGLKPAVYTKLDYLNPGGSAKDRIAIRMIDEAERNGLLQPGGTIIEGTAGNTGMGLALVAAVRGYKLIFTITDKQSREKIDLLKAFGAEVVVCPTAVPPDDARSYYSVAKKLSEEIPNSFYPNQYDNPLNPEAHYDTTGPEIWESSEGRVSHLVVGIGTGGTATGVGRYLKSKKPTVKIIGVDAIGSLYHEFFHTGRVGEAHPYVVEGIGEDIFPSTIQRAGRCHPGDRSGLLRNRASVGPTGRHLRRGFLGRCGLGGTADREVALAGRLRCRVPPRHGTPVREQGVQSNCETRPGGCPGDVPGDSHEAHHPDHGTRLARRSPAPRPPPRPGRASPPRQLSCDCGNRLKSTGKLGGCPRALPECDHRWDWVAVGAVSCEPVLHVDKRIKDECKNPGSVPEYAASEASIDSASSSRRLENAVERILKIKRLAPRFCRPIPVRR